MGEDLEGLLPIIVIGGVAYLAYESGFFNKFLNKSPIHRPVRKQMAVSQPTSNMKVSSANGTTIVPPTEGTYGVFRSGNYLTIPHSDSLNATKFTLATWFRTSKDYTHDQAGYMIAKGSYFDNVPQDNFNYMMLISCDVDPHNVLEFNWETLNGKEHYIFASGVKVNDGKWHHGAGTWNGSTSRIYVDGKLIKSKSFSGTPNFNTMPLYIGQYGPGFTTYVGDLDETRIYNRALSSSEVYNLYKGGSVSNTGLIYSNSFGGGPPVVKSTLAKAYNVDRIIMQ